MSVKINIPPLLSCLTEDQAVIEVSGSNVGQCLSQLVNKFPELETQLFGKDGKLNSGIEVYINLKSSYPEELAKTVKDGDGIQIADMIIGG